MTNFEKHKSKIFEIAAETNEAPAMKDGILVACRGLPCEECDLNENHCITSFFNWLCEDDGEKPDGCDGCKYEHKREDESPCTECCNNYISKWERKPKKTRQDEFLEMFPNVKKDALGVLTITPCSLGERERQHCGDRMCWECKRDYWLEEVEE